MPENLRSVLPGLRVEWPIGQILQNAGLLSATQVKEILREQNTHYRDMRFGELAVFKGWLRQETLDFFLDAIDRLKTQNDCSGLDLSANLAN